MTCPADCVCAVCLVVELRRAVELLGARVLVLEGRIDFLTANAKPQTPTAAEASAAVTGALVAPDTRRKLCGARSAIGFVCDLPAGHDIDGSSHEKRPTAAERAQGYGISCWGGTFDGKGRK